MKKCVNNNKENNSIFYICIYLMVKSTKEYRDPSTPKFNRNLGRNRDKNFIKKASEFKSNINNNRIEVLKFDNNTQTCPNFNEFMKYVNIVP